MERNRTSICDDQEKSQLTAAFETKASFRKRNKKAMTPRRSILHNKKKGFQTKRENHKNEIKLTKKKNE